jgi:transposase-like protein
VVHHFTGLGKPHECRSCGGTKLVKNGHRWGKQCWLCRGCGHQQVENPTKKVIGSETRELVVKAVCERMSLGAICQVFSLSMSWLLRFIRLLGALVPDDLHCQP